MPSTLSISRKGVIFRFSMSRKGVIPTCSMSRKGVWRVKCGAAAAAQIFSNSDVFATQRYAIISRMRTMVTKVAERGQTVIPSEIVEAMRLQPGMHIAWEQDIDGRSWRMSIVLPRKKRYDARDMIGFARTFRETRPTAEWMKELREGEED